jgi:glucokinase
MIPDWVGFPLRERIEERIGLPTALLNDGHAAALAESRFGAGRGRVSMLCVVIGTGLGGGVVVDGSIQHGANGLVGSVGQLKITRNGREYFPLEALVSGPGLARLYDDQHPADSAGSGFEVARRAQAGDTQAQEAILEMGKWLGLGLSHALHSCDAECVVVGGSVAQIGDLLFDATRNSLRHFGHSTVASTPILPAKLGADAGLVGAAVAALHLV